MPYERATGLSSAIERGATMVGAAIAGGLVATVGAANAVAVDAVSFGVCARAARWSRPGASSRHGSRPRRSRTGTSQPTSYVAELRDGWDFLRRDAVLMSLA